MRGVETSPERSAVVRPHPTGDKGCRWLGAGQRPVLFSAGSGGLDGQSTAHEAHEKAQHPGARNALCVVAPSSQDGGLLYKRNSAEGAASCRPGRWLCLFLSVQHPPAWGQWEIDGAPRLRASPSVQPQSVVSSVTGRH